MKVSSYINWIFIGLLSPLIFLSLCQHAYAQSDGAPDLNKIMEAMQGQGGHNSPQGGGPSVDIEKLRQLSERAKQPGGREAMEKQLFESINRQMQDHPPIDTSNCKGIGAATKNCTAGFSCNVESSPGHFSKTIIKGRDSDGRCRVVSVLPDGKIMTCRYSQNVLDVMADESEYWLKNGKNRALDPSNPNFKIMAEAGRNSCSF